MRDGRGRLTHSLEGWRETRLTQLGREGGRETGLTHSLEEGSEGGKEEERMANHLTCGNGREEKKEVNWIIEKKNHTKQTSTLSKYPESPPSSKGGGPGISQMEKGKLWSPAPASGADAGKKISLYLYCNMDISELGEIRKRLNTALLSSLD